MSRPFSYNDENFTVIGNVLFVHIIDNKARKEYEPLVEIPPAIFERLKTYTNICFASYIEVEEKPPRLTFAFTNVNSGNKNYLALPYNIPASHNDRLYWSVYFLKDI